MSRANRLGVARKMHRARRKSNAPVGKTAGVRGTSRRTVPPSTGLLSNLAWAEVGRSLKLSARELEITRGVFDNLTEGAIAGNLGVSENTIHTHLHRLFSKLRVTTRTQMVVRIMQELLMLTLSEAYGFNYWRQSMTDALQYAIRSSVVDNLNTLDDLWGPGTDYDLLPSANQPYTSAFRWWAGFWQDYSVLTNALADGSSANFYWWGHGGRFAIGPHPKKQPFLMARDVKDFLRNAALDHPYRLVILDGCETWSSEWADAFGIDFNPGGSTYTVQNFTSRGLNPQAFVGWDPTTPAPMTPDGVVWVQDALFYLWAYWQLGYPLDECLQQYAYYLVDVHGFNDDGDWLGIGANGIPDYKEYKISGCVDLTTYDR